MSDDTVTITGECSATVYHAYTHKCQRKAVTRHNGKLYCKLHDPVRKQAREAKTQAKWKHEGALLRARAAVTAARLEAADVIEQNDCTPLRVQAARHNIQRARQALAALEALTP